MLSAGGSALEAVTEAVRRLEDDPAFDAGRGSVLTREGQVRAGKKWEEGAGRRLEGVSGVGRRLEVRQQVGRWSWTR